MDETIAKDIMSTALVTLTPQDTVEEALKVLIQNKITGLPVVDKSGKMLGVLSEFDLIKQISKKPKAGGKRGAAKEFVAPDVFHERIEFSKNPESILDTTSLDVIVEKIVGAKYRRLPVLNKAGKLVGIVTRRDLMRLYFYRAKLT